MDYSEEKRNFSTIILMEPEPKVSEKNFEAVSNTKPVDLPTEEEVVNMVINLDKIL